MGELLASRRAGRSLGFVVVLLLLPVFVLWLMFFNESRSNMAALERARAGLNLSINLTPLFYGESERVTAQRLEEISLAEDGLGISEEDRFASAIAVMPSENGGTIRRDVFTLRQMLDRAVRQSGLHLEADPASAALIHATLVTLPDMVLNQQALLKELRRRVSDGTYVEDDHHYFLQTTGKNIYMLGEFEREMKIAMAAPNTDSSMRGALLLVNKLRAETHALADLSISSGPSTPAAFLLSHIDRGQNDNMFERSAAQLTHLAVGRIGAIHGARADQSWNRLALLTAAGLLCSLAALGLAIFMFKRNLSQLDHVEAAKRESDDMANQLAAINADMSDLNRDLADKMAALKAAQDEVLKKGRMEQLGQLTATVAHELRNPLGAVRTSAFLLQRKLKDLNIDAAQQFERINNGITRCDSTITQLLDFSRTKKISAKRAVFDDWLARCVEEAARQLPQSIEVECRLGLGQTEVAFDGARLERAVINLINNASEAMVGNGKDKLSTASPRIVVTTALVGDDIALTVADNGPGISAENLEKIREPLFTTKNFGTGLGIPAVEQIAVQHEGRLDIESEPGKGATFTIWLPRTSVEAIAA